MGNLANYDLHQYHGPKFRIVSREEFVENYLDNIRAKVRQWSGFEDLSDDLLNARIHTGLTRWKKGVDREMNYKYYCLVGSRIEDAIGWIAPLLK